MDGGDFGQPGAYGVDDNERRAFEYGLTDSRSRYRMRFSGIGANEHQAIGERNFGDGIGGGAGAQCLLHAPGGGSVTDARAAVDIVGADHRAHEFLHQVVFFVGAACRRNTGDGVRPVLVANGVQSVRDEIQRLVPVALRQFTVFPDQRRAQTVGGVDEFEGVAAFQTSVAVTGGRIFRAADGDHPAVFHLDFEIAAHAAVGADRASDVLALAGFGAIPVIQGVGGAGLHAAPAGHAAGAGKIGLRALNDVAVDAATLHGEDELALDFVAGAHAAVTMNTFGRVEADIGMLLLFPAALPPRRVATAANAIFPEKALKRCFLFVLFGGHPFCRELTG